MKKDHDRSDRPRIALFQRRALLLASVSFAAPVATVALLTPRTTAITSQRAWRRIRRSYDQQISGGHTAVDLEDVSLIAGSGGVRATASRAEGAHRSVNAAGQAAARHLQYYGATLTGAIVVVAGPLTGFELSESKAAFNAVRSLLAANCHCIYGTYCDPSFDNEVEVTVITRAKPMNR
ncbi:MAG: hypothetical protein Q8K29_17465 [Polaromonas sp.]|nr:hypothetical protein [Polaromonas sp.]